MQSNREDEGHTHSMTWGPIHFVYWSGQTRIKTYAKERLKMSHTEPRTEKKIAATRPTWWFTSASSVGAGVAESSPLTKYTSEKSRFGAATVSAAAVRHRNSRAAATVSSAVALIDSATIVMKAKVGDNTSETCVGWRRWNAISACWPAAQDCNKKKLEEKQMRRARHKMKVSVRHWSLRHQMSSLNEISAHFFMCSDTTIEERWGVRLSIRHPFDTTSTQRCFCICLYTKQWAYAQPLTVCFFFFSTCVVISRYACSAKLSGKKQQPPKIKEKTGFITRSS